MRLTLTTLAAVLAWASVTPALAQLPGTLEQELLARPAREWAAAARQEGDAVRGAIVFFQHQLACSKCHTPGAAAQPGALGPATLGPDLAALNKDGEKASDESLVESVLTPSKVIRKGFESVSLTLANGRTLTGLVVERTPEKIVVRDVSREGELVTFRLAEVDEVQANTQSIMPAGQVNQLASRQQFLDLLRYLIEIRDGGAARARELQPPPSLLTFTLPEYEQRLDHAGFIRDWDPDALKRGAAIYQRVCANCHGTRELQGSLPTSLRFAEGKFKNGSDPFAMYQTLTRGFGLMAPQTWMAPVQKYDVIHYIRETYLKPHNPSQFAAVDAAYLARLPKGNTRGPEPSKIEPWSAMDYGPSLTHTLEIPGGAHNLAYKGIAVRLDPGAGGVSRGRHWMVFDTDTLRMAAAWSSQEKPEDAATKPENAEKTAKGQPEKKGQPNKKREADKNPTFIDWRGIQFNGEHQVHPRVVGQVAVANPTGPGWADPASGSWRDDQRVLGRDGRQYGPLPRSWGRFRGLYHHGQQTILSYTVGEAAVLELPRLLPRDGAPVFLRTFHIGPRERDLTLLVATQPSGSQPVVAGVAPAGTAASLSTEAGRLMLRIPRGAEPLKFTLWTAAEMKTPDAPAIPDADLDLTTLTRGGPARWTQKLETRAVAGADNGPFAVDVLTPPDSNPWLAQLRFSGLDFLPDGRMAACTWDGDVWTVEGFSGGPQLRWQRIATGLYQPLGLKVVGGKIHVLCRDQLAVLHDLNGGGETDFYECLNNDHQVTEHFHEFAMGLQTDREGNFYYAKSGRHALAAVVPHHGTLLRVTPDGARTEILANGFRAANGVCLNPDGSFVVTDQEGFWNPKNRLNWVTYEPGAKPKFYGNMFGYTDVTDSSDAAMEPPLCWITNAFDRSPAELLWVDSAKWGPLDGALLNLSYGYGKVFVVPHERVGSHMQGGMVALPIPNLPTGVMRGRFHAADGQLYLCGMFAWAGNATQPGGLYRLRATGQPMHLPRELHAAKSGLRLVFTAPLDPASIDPRNVQIMTWGLKRSAGYGSKHYNEKPLAVRSARLSEDGKTLHLETPDLQPTWCMEIKYSLRSAAGEAVSGVIHNTIHALGE